MENKVKGYVEQLLKRFNIGVAQHHGEMFDDFVQNETVVAGYHTIQKIQTDMLDKWKEKVSIETIQSKPVVLSNGTVGKLYEFSFDPEALGLTEVGEFELLIGEKVGVQYNPETRKIQGVLAEAGEHILTLKFKLKNSPEDRPFLQKEIKLIVNPDPKSLWRNEASNRGDEYWKEDNTSSCFDFGAKKLIIASKRGRSHAHEGKFRDDDFDYVFLDDFGWGVIAIADGAGSAKYSRQGSKIACESVVEYFRRVEKEKWDELEQSISTYLADASEDNQKKLSAGFIGLLGQAAFGAQGKIREEAGRKTAEMRDFSTTLLFSLVKKLDTRFVIASFWVGDGGIGIYDENKKEVSVLGVPDSGEFAGQTKFLTMSDIFADGAYASRIRFKVVDDFTALILMTDGITDPKFQTDANLNKYDKWTELWADLSGHNPDQCKVDFSRPAEETAPALMDWLDFWSPGNHDDRTIAILY